MKVRARKRTFFFNGKKQIVAKQSKLINCLNEMEMKVGWKRGGSNYLLMVKTSVRQVVLLSKQKRSSDAF